MNNLFGAFKSMQRNFSMTFASILLVSLTLLVIGFIGLITLNTNHITNNVLKSLTINVYVAKTASPEESAAVGVEIEKIPGINSTTFSSKDEELNLLASGMSNSDLTTFFQGTANPLEDVYLVTLDNPETDMQTIADQVLTIPNVTDVKYGSGAGTDNFISTMLLIQKISILIAFLLIIVSMFIIINTIKLTITSRRDEIEIMRLVGATKMYIRLPFMFEGLLIGLIGGIIGTIILMIGYDQMLSSQFIISFKSSLLTLGEVLIFLLIGLPISGMIIGSFASYLATIKYLNK
ncbi:MAG: permease-like cell division protein FtsX [Mycoplasmatales bacterium]